MSDTPESPALKANESESEALSDVPDSSSAIFEVNFLPFLEIKCYELTWN